MTAGFAARSRLFGRLKMTNVALYMQLLGHILPGRGLPTPSERAHTVPGCDASLRSGGVRGFIVLPRTSGSDPV